MDEPVYCLNCRKPIDNLLTVCPYCGRDQLARVEQAPPAPQYIPPQATQPAYYAPPMDQELYELALQYKTAKSNVMWSFWLGLFCLWPLWIWTYLENSKLQMIRTRVAARGINPTIWVNQIYMPPPR